MPPLSGSTVRGRPAQPGTRSMTLALSRSTPMAHSVSAARLADIAPQSQAQRYRQISRVLARHGLGYFISVVGLERLVPLQRILNRGYEQPMSRPEHVRRAVGQRRRTLIKLGHDDANRAG